MIGRYPCANFDKRCERARPLSSPGSPGSEPPRSPKSATGGCILRACRTTPSPATTTLRESQRSSKAFLFSFFGHINRAFKSLASCPARLILSPLFACSVVFKKTAGELIYLALCILFRNSVALLDLADQLLPLALDHFQVAVRQLSPLLADFSRVLFPFPFHLFPIHWRSPGLEFQRRVLNISFARPRVRRSPLEKHALS